jgi:hypothetical protein
MFHPQTNGEPSFTHRFVHRYVLHRVRQRVA